MFSQLMKELVSTKIYKSSQGRVARRMTFIGLSLVFIWGGFSLYNADFAKRSDSEPASVVEDDSASTDVVASEAPVSETETAPETTADENSVAVPQSTETAKTNVGFAVAGLLVAVLGVWVSFRVINIPTFADFLVSVEAEMSKVSWPSKRDLFANTKVVLIFMALFTALIFVYDFIFKTIFTLFG